MAETQYVLSISYGKDSLACLGAIEQLGLPLDRIIHSEVWATDDIPADPPPMVEFKAKADQIIKERWGIEVEHLCAMKDGEKITYEKLFYHIPNRRTPKRNDDDWGGRPKGFPLTLGAWCKHLKTQLVRIPNIGQPRELVYGAQNKGRSWDSPSFEEIGVPATSNEEFFQSSLAQGADISIVQYLGIAADEPERIERHTKPGVILPLVKMGWTEADCRKWCEENDLLSPIYTTASRGGVLVLPQSGCRTITPVAENLSRSMGLALEMGQRLSYHFSRRRSYRTRLRQEIQSGGLGLGSN